MRTISKHVLVALSGVIFLASCSRPVAYFQRTPTERFHSPKTETVAVVDQPAALTEQPTAVTPTVAPVPAEQVAQTKQVMDQLEAYVRNDSKLASNKKLARRMAHVNDVLATATTKNSLSTTRKATLMERIMLKKIDKRIKNHMSPDEASYLNKNTKNGIIIGAVGLILSLIFSGVIGVIGLVLLVVGIVLILLGVLE